MEPKPLLLCIMGPTASGKTDLAIRLAEQLHGELISVDSALVYRGLDIGSAKPDYPHHLIDIRDPMQVYSAADFARDAGELVQQIADRGRTPILVGGTMLYFRALLQGLSPMPEADPALRAAIEAEAAQYGWAHLHAELARVDPEAAQRIHPNHSQRLARALEVYRASGIPLSDWHSGDAVVPELDRFRLLQLAICPQPRAILHRRIALRFEAMIQAGFVDEVRALRARGDLSPDLPAMRAVGYRQLWHYLEGDCDLDTAKAQAIAATRQLAKRQLTWLRKWPDLAWIWTDIDGNVVDSTLSEFALGRTGKITDPADLVLNYLGINTM
jgi:tRNA dimethylallyltransferase